MLSRTILLSDLILPPDIQNISRNQLLTDDMLEQDRRANGMDVFCLQWSEIEFLREREGEIFCSLES